MADEEKNVLDLESFEEERVEVETEEKEKSESELEESEDDENVEEEVETETETAEDDDSLEAKSEEGEEEEEESENSDDEEEESENSDDEEEDTFDSLISDKYAEKYDINSEEELGEILDNVEDVLKQNEELKAEFEKSKDAAPKFKSKKEEKAFEFLQNYDIDKFGNGLGNLSKLIGMDVDKIDGKLALQEAYVLKNTELDREDALELFNEDFDKYSVDRDDFEEEGDYNKKQKLKDIRRKQDVLNAKKFLSEQQEKVKASKEDEDTSKKADTKVAEVNKESLSKYSKEVESSMKGFTSLIVSSGEDGEGKEEFTYKLSKDELNQVDLSLKAYINNPSLYNDGEIKDFNPDETKVNVAMALFGDKMLSEAIKYGISVGEGKKIEKIGSKKPKRKPQANKHNDDLSSDAQFEKLAEERKKRRDSETQYA